MIVEFFQRFAHFFSFFGGLLVVTLLLGNKQPWYVNLAVFVPVSAAIYWLLRKDGVTNNRRKRGKGRLD